MYLLKLGYVSAQFKVFIMRRFLILDKLVLSWDKYHLITLNLLVSLLKPVVVLTVVENSKVALNL